jgi:hypothetical protein
MPAAITEFVDINVVVGAAAPDRFSFGNLMGVFEHNVTSNRQDGPYASVAEAETAGFTAGAAPEINAWLNAVFAQDAGVDSVLIGRKIPSAGGPLDQVWQVEDSPLTFVDQTANANSGTAADWIVFPATEALGDYVAIGSAVPFTSLTLSNAGGTAGVGGTVDWEYWDGAAWVALAGVVDGTTGFTAAPSAGQVVSFTLPANWAPVVLNSGDALYYVRAVITQVYATNPVYSQGVVTGDVDYPAALSAIAAVAGDESWYGHTIQSRVQSDIEDVAAWTESRFHFFIPQSADATFLSGTAGNVGEVLESAGYKRTAGPLYHAVSSGVLNGYADGAWASRGFGMDLDAPGGRGIWAYKQLSGIVYDNVTSAQASNIYDVNGNIYGRNKGLSFTSKGTTAFGAPYFIDIQTTIDWIKARLEEDILALFVSKNVIPYSNAGINLIAATVKARLDQGVTFGHFSPDFPTEVNVPDVANVSVSDKQNRELSIQASAVFAGAIQKLTLDLNLSF